MPERRAVMNRPAPLPPLAASRRTDQPAVHALDEAPSPDTRAELIQGVVDMPGPGEIADGATSVRVIVWPAAHREPARRQAPAETR